jgi:hypothetical protein
LYGDLGAVPNKVTFTYYHIFGPEQDIDLSRPNLTDYCKLTVLRGELFLPLSKML